MIDSLQRTVSAVPLPTWAIWLLAVVVIFVVLNGLIRLHLWARGRALSRRLSAAETARDRLQHELVVLRQHAEYAGRLRTELGSGTLSF
jgi:DNA-binding protein